MNLRQTSPGLLVRSQTLSTRRQSRKKNFEEEQKSQIKLGSKRVKDKEPQLCGGSELNWFLAWKGKKPLLPPGGREDLQERQWSQGNLWTLEKPLSPHSPQGEAWFASNKYHRHIIFLQNLDLTPLSDKKKNFFSNLHPNVVAFDFPSSFSMLTVLGSLSYFLLELSQAISITTILPLTKPAHELSKNTCRFPVPHNLEPFYQPQEAQSRAEESRSKPWLCPSQSRGLRQVTLFL